MDQSRKQRRRRLPLRSKPDPFILPSMAEFKYRGRVVGSSDILYIRELIAAHPQASRRRLSKKLCEAWQWRQANGALSDMVCRGLLLMLERAGQITLPPVKYVRHNPLAHRARPEPLLIDATPIQGELRDLGPLEFQLVRRTAEEPLFNSLLEQHHYLGYEQGVGENLKYLVWAQSRPLACPGRVRHDTWGRAIVLSAGRRQHGGRTFASSPTTFAISFCLGCRCNTWLPTFWVAWQHASPKIGCTAMAIRCTS